MEIVHRGSRIELLNESGVPCGVLGIVRFPGSVVSDVELDEFFHGETIPVPNDEFRITGREF